MMKKFFILFALFSVSRTAAASLEYKTTFSYENKNYLADRSQHPINDEETVQTEAELSYDNEKFFQVFAHPRFKFDFIDHDRNRYLPLEAYLDLYNDHLEWKNGLIQDNWGMANSFNPTNVLNRTDNEDDYFDPERLGEIMSQIKWAIQPKGLIN